MRVVNTQEVEAQIKDHTANLTVVDCFTTWCGPCKAIKPVLDSLEKAYPAVSFLAVDIDNNPDFASKMNVRSVPTLLYIKNGQVVRTTRGLQKEQSLREVIDPLVSSPTETA